MEYSKSTSGEACRVKIQGKFTFSDHIEFKKIFGVFDEANLKQLDIDIGNVEFVDSAALGLLLLLRDEAEKRKVALTIYKPTGQVQKMFKISRFYELFNVVD